MAEILHQLTCSLSHNLQGFIYIPTGVVLFSGNSTSNSRKIINSELPAMAFQAKGRVCRIVDLDSPSVGFRGGVEEQLLPRKTNMSPEKQWLEDVDPLEIVPF